MKYVLSGIGTGNKGAELMFYAILQEIERKDPNGIVYVPFPQMACKPLSYMETKLTLKYVPYYFFVRVFRKLGFAKAAQHIMNLPARGVDYLIDASGFQFSDQFNLTEWDLYIWCDLFKSYKKYGAKICLLPQAFGPFEQNNSKRILKTIEECSNIVYAREEISYNYLKEAGFSMHKVSLKTDFTSLVEGRMPQQYQNLKGSVCLIPNTQMTRKKMSLVAYLEIMKHIITTVQKEGKEIYLLNHESGDDERLAYRIQEYVGGNINVVTGLNSLEVKGMISSSYLCISSRYHGVASSLNTCVPCLATSWSHKYSELFKDYGMKDCILPVDDKNAMSAKIHDFLHDRKNKEIREQLLKVKPYIQRQTRDMWKEVWTI